jgi:hypothetical protein
MFLYSVHVYFEGATLVNCKAGKGKKGSCPCALTEHHAMKAYGGLGVQLQSFFDVSTRRR